MAYFDEDAPEGRSGVDYPGRYVLRGDEPNVGSLRKRNRFRSFLDTMQGQDGAVGALSGLANRGGVLGGIGKFARFLI